MPPRPSVPSALIVAAIVWIAAIGAFYAAWFAGAIDAAVPAGLSSGRYEFELVSDARKSDYGYAAEAKVRDASGFVHDVQVLYGEDDASAIVAAGGSALLRSRERVAASASFSPFSDEAFLRYAKGGLACRARLSDISFADDQGLVSGIAAARRWAIAAFDHVDDGPGAALLRAVLLGDRSHLEDDGLYDAMKTVGLAHLVAVSGAHLSVVGAFAAALLARSRAPRRAVAVVLCCLYVAYAVFTGLSAPVVRAALMAGIVVCVAWTDRRASSLSALGVCACALIALDSAIAFSLSFFLSAASTLGIVVLSPLLKAWFGAALAGRADAAADACALTTAANIPILPVTACVFARVPLLSPLSNLVAAPAFSVLLGGGLASLAVCAVAPDAGYVLLGAVSCIAGAFCALCTAASHVPFASVPCSAEVAPAAVAATAAFAGLWLCWPAPRARLLRAAAALGCAASIAAVCAAPLFFADEVVMLNVGQGDAILVRSQGRTLLVDTGNQDALLSAALARAHVARLDAVAVTHHDDDHCGSLPTLAPQLAGSVSYVSAPTLSCGCEGCDALLSSAADAVAADAPAGLGGAVRGLALGDEFDVGRFACRVVWPGPFSEEGGNADSLCLLVSYDAQDDGEAEFRALLTGDAEAEQIAAIADGLAAEGIGRIDVVKAGHHGSRAGIDEATARALSPSVVLVSCGANNRYGHPAPETLSAFEQAGAVVARTDTQGDVTARFSADGIEFFTQK